MHLPQASIVLIGRVTSAKTHYQIQNNRCKKEVYKRERDNTHRETQVMDKHKSREVVFKSRGAMLGMKA